MTLFDIVLEQFPDIAPPTVMVMTSYPGASAETVQIYVYFRQGTDPDMATVNVMNRVSMATGSLPAEVNKIGVTVHNLIPDDITGILAEQNIEAATGSFGESSGSAFEYTMKYTGRKMTPEEFGEMVISASPTGEVLRLSVIVCAGLFVFLLMTTRTGFVPDEDLGTIMMAAWMAGSCGIWRKFQEPEPDGDISLLFGREYMTEDSTSMADLGWRELFTDPLLAALIEKGLESNTDVQTARLHTEQASETGLISAVACQYYTLLMLDRQYEIAGQTAAKFQKSVEVLEAMKEAGMANETAIAQMRGAYWQVVAGRESIAQPGRGPL